MGLIKKPNELEPRTTIAALIYGQAGMGKTTLALSAPRPLLLDFDDGVHRVAARHRTDTVQPRSWGEVMEVITKEDLSGFDTIVIDTAGKMLEYMSKDIIDRNRKMGYNGNLNQQGYGERKSVFKNFLLTLAALKKHVIFVAHERVDRDGEGVVKTPEMTGSSKTDLTQDIDLMGYVEAHGNTRTISFGPNARFTSKRTVATIEDVINLPDVRQHDNVLMTDLVERFQESLADQVSMAKAYGDLVAQIDERASEINSPESAKAFADWMAGIDEVWDSRRVAVIRFKTALAKCGITYNKDTGEYSDAN